MSPDYLQILDTLQREVQPLLRQGKVASYIPELAKVAPDHFGMAVYCLDGRTFSVGDAHRKFSLQSITKLFALALAFSREGDDIWRRVGREPSGNPFNSLVQLEYERGIPRNPFGNLHNPVDVVIDAYCHQCSITMTCVELAKAGSFLVQHGTIPWSGTQILDASSAKRLNALMLTCGT